MTGFIRLKAEVLILFVTIVAIGTSFLPWKPLDGMNIIFFVLMMILTGIPHGAIDHYLFSVPKELPLFNARFFVTYLGLMVCYAVLWIWMPFLSLIVFFLLSAYHFGQSQLYYFNIPEHHFLKIFLYVLWGLGILTALLSFHEQESLVISEEMVGQHHLTNYLFQEIFPLLFPGSLFLWLFLMILLCFFYKAISLRQLFKENMNLVLLLLLFKTQDLFTAFTIYFGFWHAIQSIQKEIQVLHSPERPFELWNFYKAALPFTLISLVGIIFLILLTQFLEAFVSPVVVFFIAISILTFPHTWLMSKIYTKL